MLCWELRVYVVGWMHQLPVLVGKEVQELCVCMHVCTVCDVAHLTVANLLYILALVLQ